MNQQNQMLRFLETVGGSILILCSGLFVFSLLCITVAWFFPENRDVYLLFSGIVGGFSGALLSVIRIKGTPSAVDVSGGSGNKSVEVNLAPNEKTKIDGVEITGTK